MNFKTTKGRDHLIRDSLRVWREERHIKVESQFDGFLGNIAEELTELLRAQDVYEKVDALCDIMIFSINIIGTSIPKDKVAFLLGKLAMPDKTESNYQILLFRILGLNEDIMSKAYGLILACEEYLTYLKFDYKSCLEETVKEISSRTGYWDTKISKFVKDESPSVRKKWYKADYSICKLKTRSKK